jgi:hypothetical protein
VWLECHAVLALLSKGYSPLKGRLPTLYSPVRHSTRHPKVTFAFDLHVLSAPPAFALSQDQTLQFKLFNPDPERPGSSVEWCLIRFEHWHSREYHVQPNWMLLKNRQLHTTLQPI